MISSAKQVAAGGDALPNAATALAKAGLASRTNTLFSIPMAFFMAASLHLPGPGGLMWGNGVSMTAFVAALIVMVALQLNGMMGKMGPMATVRGVVHMGVLLTVVLYLITSLL